MHIYRHTKGGILMPATELRGGTNEAINGLLAWPGETFGVSSPEDVIAARQIDVLKIAESITSGSPFQAGQRAVALCEACGLRADALGAKMAETFDAAELAYMLGVLLVTIGVSPAGRR
jgi:hypothetical protein